MVETRSRETIVEAVNDDYQTDDDCMMIIMILIIMEITTIPRF